MKINLISANKDLKLTSAKRFQIISHADSVMALYSNLTLDKDAMFCIFCFHETRFPPAKNTITHDSYTL